MSEERKYKKYVGIPGDDYEVDVIMPSGAKRPLHHVVLHSPTGFCWGYEGSGPADLALSLLCDVLGERPGKKQLYHGTYKAASFYQKFKRKYVAQWNMDEPFEIGEEKIRDWLMGHGVIVN